MSRSQLHDLHSGHRVTAVDNSPPHKNRGPTDDVDRLIAEGLADARRLDAEKATKIAPSEHRVNGAHENGTKTNESSTLVAAKDASSASSDGQQVQQSAAAVASNPAQSQHIADSPAAKAVNNKQATNIHQEEVSKSALPTEKVKKPMVLVVRDLDTSPEEKMALMSRYSFTPRKV